MSRVLGDQGLRFAFSRKASQAAGMQARMQPISPPYNPDYDPWHEDSDESEFLYGEPSEFQRVQAALQTAVLT